MIFSHGNLARVIDDMLSSTDEIDRARAENFRFEERVGAERQSRYEAGFTPRQSTRKDFDHSHMR